MAMSCTLVHLLRRDVPEILFDPHTSGVDFATAIGNEEGEGERARKREKGGRKKRVGEEKGEEEESRREWKEKKKEKREQEEATSNKGEVEEPQKKKEKGEGERRMNS